MADHSSKLTVYGAVVANTLIAISKFTAAAFTGSSAMLSEGIHSVVDSGNSLLLLFGIHRSERPPDEHHPFGHGKELYFWSLIVAMIIFGVGGGMSIYEGVIHIVHRSEPGDPTWNYVVLGLAMLFEGASWTIAFREFGRGRRRALGFLQAVRRSKDPTIYTVLFEDSAALLGLVLAFLGVFLGRQLDMPALDGAASIAIGAMLCGVAVFLAYESRGLLVGESADPEQIEHIVQVATADPAVERVERPLTMHLGPHDVLLNLGITFRQGLTLAQVEAAVTRLENAIRAEHPDIRQIFIEASSIRSAKNGDGLP
ncbi:MAG: cation transporter [Acidobacteria bacterium]|nr:cation transporter [Acidobacteriota bacterium]